MREGSLVMPTSLSPDAVARVQGRDHLLVGVQGGLGGEVRVRVGGEERVARTPRRCRDPAAARRYRCRVPPPRTIRPPTTHRPPANRSTTDTSAFRQHGLATRRRLNSPFARAVNT